MPYTLNSPSTSRPERAHRPAFGRPVSPARRRARLLVQARPYRRAFAVRHRHQGQAVAAKPRRPPSAIPRHVSPCCSHGLVQPGLASLSAGQSCTRRIRLVAERTPAPQPCSTQTARPPGQVDPFLTTHLGSGQLWPGLAKPALFHSAQIQPLPMARYAPATGKAASLQGTLITCSARRRIDPAVPAAH